MTSIELMNRISLTVEYPPCPIDFSMRGFCAWDYEVDIMVASIGVAVALVGCEPLNKLHLERGYRSKVSGMEWHQLMHFEMAINTLFDGRITKYNEIAEFIDLPKFGAEVFPQIKKWRSAL
jgi:hypothetical protein